jgi:hypothetical protein
MVRAMPPATGWQAGVIAHAEPHAKRGRQWPQPEEHDEEKG